MSDVAISVKNLTKIYRLYDDPVDRLKESLHPFRKQYHREFYALDNINFEVKKGEALGIIGKNGSGKSTLLKIITGVLTPSHGGAAVEGRVSALLELGAGFNPELTGVENIYFNGTLLGFSRQEMDTKVDDVLSFADIGEFAYQPVKTYSSGMFVRLAFGVAVIVEPDILIIDEALSVGDVRFQQKCMAKIKELSANKTVIFVSHDTHAITELCDRVVWLNNGRLVLDGEPKYISEKYQEYMYSSTADEPLVVESNAKLEEGEAKDDFEPIDSQCRQFGDRRAEIVGVKVVSPHGENLCAYSGQWLELKFMVKVDKKINNPIFGFLLKDRLGRELLGDNSHLMRELFKPLQPNENSVVTFRFESWPNIYPGEYCLSVAMADGVYEEHQQCHWIHDALVIKSVSARVPGGLFSDLQTTVFLSDIG